MNTKLQRHARKSVKKRRHTKLCGLNQAIHELQITCRKCLSQLDGVQARRDGVYLLSDENPNLFLALRLKKQQLHGLRNALMQNVQCIGSKRDLIERTCKLEFASSIMQSGPATTCSLKSEEQSQVNDSRNMILARHIQLIAHELRASCSSRSDASKDRSIYAAHPLDDLRVRVLDRDDTARLLPESSTNSLQVPLIERHHVHSNRCATALGIGSSMAQKAIKRDRVRALD